MDLGCGVSNHQRVPTSAIRMIAVTPRSELRFDKDPIIILTGISPRVEISSWIRTSPIALVSGMIPTLSQIWTSPSAYSQAYTYLELSANLCKPLPPSVGPTRLDGPMEASTFRPLMWAMPGLIVVGHQATQLQFLGYGLTPYITTSRSRCRVFSFKLYVLYFQPFPYSTSPVSSPTTLSE